tara:strand:+ start:493 stop:603 length:111 start_codon:yes stop_codon:yes gene_type:complete
MMIENIDLITVLGALILFMSVVAVLAPTVAQESRDS